MSEEQHMRALRAELVRICLFETLKDYANRNRAVIAALHHALAYGYEAGIRVDEDDLAWPIVFIELPTGQVTWHIEQHGNGWDGHDTEQKYARVKEYLGKHV